ncbi:hypothetical protein D3C85_1471740 [compost metagenome]
MYAAYALGGLGSLAGKLLEVGARRLAGEQDHAVIAGDHDVRVGFQVGAGALDLGAHLGRQGLVIDGLADGAAAASGQCETEGQAGEDQGGTDHSSLPKS